MSYKNGLEKAPSEGRFFINFYIGLKASSLQLLRLLTYKLYIGLYFKNITIFLIRFKRYMYIFSHLKFYLDWWS